MNQIDPKLSIIGNRVLEASNIPNDKKFGEIMAILMIISIILTVIRVLQECNKTSDQFTATEKCQFYGQQIKTYSSRRSWFTKRRIQKIIQQKMCKDDYYKYSLPIMQALFSVGENVTDDEVLTLMEQANV